MTTQMTTRTEATCGCPEFDQGRTLSRRRFLATTAAVTGAAASAQLFGDAYRQVAYGATTGGNVVVVLSLRGGADGLSMVVPRGADYTALAALRPGIVVPDGSLIAKDDHFGLHPSFAPLEKMWTAGTFGAVHAVGLPMPNRSHFEAMAAIEDADITTSARIGWINRTVGLTTAGVPEEAIGMGSAMMPTSLVGPAPALSVNAVSDLSVAPLNTTSTVRNDSLRAMYANETGALGDTMRSTLAATDRLAGLAATKIDTTTYPIGPLQKVLANTAALIKADVGTQMVTVDYGNWDMHSGLGKSDATGWMSDQVTHLAGSLKAFFDDLGAAASRVTVVTMSEFGRRVKENGDHGVDHGYGNVMLMLGAGVKGGQVNGAWPGLTALKDGDLAVRQDYRSVLWEVIGSRFPDLSGKRASIFPGLVPETVGSMA